MNEDNNISKWELYKIARETRNFEISLFWQRSNYFLVLNTAVAVGFFSLKDSFYALPLGLFGFVASLLWFLVNLGSKFWQSRWEHRLYLAEENLSKEIQFFSADWNTIKSDVQESLKFANHSRPRRLFDRLVLKKPSVSFMMTLLSVTFVLFWFLLVILHWFGIGEC